MKIRKALLKPPVYVVLVVAVVGLGLLLWRINARPEALLTGRVGGFLFRPFFNIGDVALTPVFLIKTTLYLVALGLATSMTRRTVQSRILSHTNLDGGQQYAFARILGYLVFLVGIVVGLESAGLKLDSLLLFGGTAGIGIGLGLQTVANNFVSGLVLLFERPVKLGDRVEVGGVVGDVMRIAGRSTWVRTNDNVVIIVPNSEFVSNRVTNWTANDLSVRFSVPLGVSYGCEPEKVREILLAVARQEPTVLVSPEPDVLFRGFGDSALNFDLRVWTTQRVTTPQVLTSDLYFAIFRAFRENGIEIPFPQRDLHVKSMPVPVSLPM